ncbi:hypothetical protein [Orenia marismortui]|uniref:Uncharacterized protein n=1 Tax=Orenia marismortui TaxID=46469 RepID=A0A4R8GL01_9FIRM|nr:hypothetical protein [Orenia marismortui]TDX43794.1 hypothetical protein C7959_1585 [Orenia marismortui]
MTEDDFKDIEEIEGNETTSNNIGNLFNSDFLLLIVILFIFFGNTDIFSEHFQFLNGKVKQIKNYLDMADATIQALDQASQIPNQMLK